MMHFQFGKCLLQYRYIVGSVRAERNGWYKYKIKTSLYYRYGCIDALQLYKKKRKALLYIYRNVASLDCWLRIYFLNDAELNLQFTHTDQYEKDNV